MKVLVTGGAGFIGGNFVHHMVNKYPDYQIVNLDLLTYAGNLETLKPVEDKPNYKFVKGDIADEAFIMDLFEKEKFDVVVNFAAESHVDRSIEDPGIFVQTNVMGTRVLLDASRKFGVKRYHQVSTDEVYGDLPLDRPVLYVGNHRSYFDILVGYTTVPGLMGFVAKKEMEKIPLLSKWMLNVNCLFLDRNNIKEGLKTILAGIEKVRRGVSVWIFPEGTRNKNEQLSDLLPFKEGSLKIAEKSGCPVVPVAIKGTAEVFEKHIPLICPSHVVIEFGEPFIVKELDPENRKFVGAYTREKIAGMLSEMEKENS